VGNDNAVLEGGLFLNDLLQKGVNSWEKAFQSAQGKEEVGGQLSYGIKGKSFVFGKKLFF